MTNNTKSKREILWEEDDFFQQQSPYLQALGVNRAADTEDDKHDDFFCNIDLYVHEESERFSSCFASNAERAPLTVVSLLADTMLLGKRHGVASEFMALVAAYVFNRITAAGDGVSKRHERICASIRSSQMGSPRRKESFERYCREMEKNNFDLVTGERVCYHCGDPIKPLKPAVADEPKGPSPLAEVLLAQVLDATQGWNTEGAFAGRWNLWTGLWRMLLENGDFAQTISKRCPASYANKTLINMRAVCNVAGLFKHHLEGKGFISIPDRKFAESVRKKWDTDACRREIAKAANLTEEMVGLVTEWLSDSRGG